MPTRRQKDEAHDFLDRLEDILRGEIAYPSRYASLEDARAALEDIRTKERDLRDLGRELAAVMEDVKAGRADPGLIARLRRLFGQADGGDDLAPLALARHVAGQALLALDKAKATVKAWVMREVRRQQAQALYEQAARLWEAGREEEAVAILRTIQNYPAARDTLRHIQRR